MSSLATRMTDLPAETGFVHGHGQAMRALNALAAEIARTDIPVLVVGESGTGKDVYARLVHRLSPFADGAFERVNCALLDPGQFSAQIQDGMRSARENGSQQTLFLDGIDELDLSCQRVLLALLPDGSSRAATSGLRLISSASRGLDEEVDAGRFRRELYFRLNGVCLRLPPLRERKEDIPALLECLLEKHAGPLGRRPPAISPEAQDLLSAHDWPGNIRELENVAKKILALGDPQAAMEDLRFGAEADATGTERPRISSLKVAARAASRRTERELILKALEHTHWNRKRAAQELQISYKSLLYKIKQIGVAGDTGKA
jgi:DNA-binding NtrC family response regulator